MIHIFFKRERIPVNYKILSLKKYPSENLINLFLFSIFVISFYIKNCDFFRKDSLHDEENEEDEHKWNQISNDLDEEPLTRLSGQSTKDTIHPM